MALTITTDLRFEHYDRALGIGERTPRLSWKTTAAPEWQQAGYEL